MAASFRAYIDESGDEGFRFRAAPMDSASSDWFVLGALVTRKRADVDTVRLVDRVRAEFGLPPKKHIHWKDLNHARKVRYAQLIATLRVRAVAVCVHKPSLQEPETFRERYRLYFYAVRYLLERLSWLARDRHNPATWGGDGSAQVVFSNRQGMSYVEMKDYLALLRTRQESGQDVRIDFERVPVDGISAQTPGRSMGLQLADAVAGAFFNALERDRFGNTEPRYVQTLSPILYRHEGELTGYGMKVVPRDAVAALRAEPALAWWLTLK